MKKNVRNYRHISLVRGSSRKPSGGRSGHHVGDIFGCPMRFDRSFQVFLFSCIGAVLAVSGLTSASQAGKYIKTTWISRKTSFATRLCLLFPSKTRFFGPPLAASRHGRQPQTTDCLQMCLQPRPHHNVSISLPAKSAHVTAKTPHFTKGLSIGLP